MRALGTPAPEQATHGEARPDIKEVIKIDTSDKPNRPLTTLRNLHLGGIG